MRLAAYLAHQKMSSVTLQAPLRDCLFAARASCPCLACGDKRGIGVFVRLFQLTAETGISYGGDMKKFSLLSLLFLTQASIAFANDTWKLEWPETDFSKTSIDLAEISSGGPPRDGIPVW